MTGPTSTKCSNVNDHETSDGHKAAMVKKEDCVKASSWSVVLSSPVDCYVANSDDETQA